MLCSVIIYGAAVAQRVRAPDSYGGAWDIRRSGVRSPAAALPSLNMVFYLVSLGRLGEKGFILNYISKHLSRDVLLDDAYYVRVASGDYLVLKVDGFSLRSAKYPWMDYYDVGWKVVTSVVSDLVAKYATPKYVLVSIGLNRGRSVSEAEDLISGVSDACRYYGASLVGGDTNVSEGDEWVDAVAVGTSPNPIPIRAKDPGDYIIIVGEYGVTGLAYELYVRDVKKLPNKVIEVTKRPKARVELLNVFTKFRDCICVSTDVSDGLAEALHRLSTINEVSITINELCIPKEVKAMIKNLGLDPMDVALRGGEEFEVIFTTKTECLDGLINELRRFNIPFTIGVLRRGMHKVIVNSRKVPYVGWDNYLGYTTIETK